MQQPIITIIHMTRANRTTLWVSRETQQIVAALRDRDGHTTTDDVVREALAAHIGR